MELIFDPISNETLSQLQPYFSRTNTRLCNYSCGIILMWKSCYLSEICKVNDELIFRGELNGKVYFSLVHYDDTDVNVLKALYNYSMQMYGYFLLFPVPTQYLNYIKSVLPPLQDEQTSPDWDDYLYNIDDLVNLNGSKYDGKRNHIKRFIKENSNIKLTIINNSNMIDTNIDNHFNKIVRYINGNKITDNNETDLNEINTIIENTIEFVRVFGSHIQEGSSFEYENNRAMELLSNVMNFPIITAVLSVNDKIIGVTCGEIIGDTLHVHIEKADRNYNGTYTYLNNSFAKYIKSIDENIKYINREEDDGDEGLRRAKESYHPCEKLGKYILTWTLPCG